MRAVLLIAGAAALLSGCSISLIGKASPPPPFLMNLTTTAENTPKPSESRVVKALDVVVISLPTVPQALAQNRVPVTRDGTAIAYLTGGSWVEQPAKLFHRLMSETVRARTGRHVLDLRQFPGEPGAVVSGQLIHMDVEENTKKVFMVYEATVVTADKRVRTRRFETSEPVAAIEAKAVADALNTAANRMAGDVASWIVE
jgi:cholesterol transport system auxiliary component